MSRRTPETLVDWLVVGIAPFLIMLLVGSLVFYLVEVFYHGDYPLRLLWVLGLFVMAIVCVARISMEEGAAYASMYGLPLALAVGLAVATFVQVRGPLAPVGPLLNWALMGLIWWAAHKLTWDCTLIEGGKDFTGQGLMQTTGLDRFFRIKTPVVNQATTENPAPPQPDLRGTSETVAPKAAALPVWQWWLHRDDRPHAPGVWVIYFSLAAIPLFGLGQWFMPSGDLILRRRAFWLLVVYVAAGLTLLMSTSFLSLRRYLRQRKLEMPGEMAAVWLGTGAVMVVALLLLASLLPRPNPEYSITHLAPDIRSPDLSPSRWGWGKEGTKPKGGAPQTATQGQPAQGKGSEGPKGQPSQPGSQQGSGNQGGSTGSGQQSGGQQSNGQQSSQQQSGNQGLNSQQGKSGQDNSQGQQNQPNGNQQSANQQSNGQGSQQSQSNPSNQSPENAAQNPAANNPNQPPNANQQKSESKNNSPDKSNNQSAQSQNNQSSDPSTPPLPTETPAPPPPTPWNISAAIGQFFAYLMHALKWLFYLAVVGIIAYYGWKNREWLLAAWQQLLKELRDLWAKWFGIKPAPTAAAVEAAPAPPRHKSFADFADPFSSGLAARWPLAELVRYTFAAFEARGRDRDCPRGNEQTPLEYAAVVGQLEPTLAGEFRALADLYCQLAFAGGNVSPQAATQLKQLWQQWR